MKKLFFASIVMLAMTTSCNNDESINEQPAPNNQNSKVFSKTNEDDSVKIPEGYTENPVDVDALDAIKTIQEDFQTDSNTSGKIICHTPYNTSHGNACVRSGGHLFNVMWQEAPTLVFDNNGNHHWEIQQHYYVSDPLQSCKCGS